MRIAAGRHTEDMPLDRVVERVEPHEPVAGLDHARDLETGRRHHVVADPEPMRVIGIEGRDQRAIQPPGGSLDQIEPVLILELLHDAGRAVFVGREYLGGPLITREDLEGERLVLSPRDPRQVLERVVVPHDLDPFGGRGIDHVEGHDRVGRARTRVADPTGFRGGIRRLGDPPGLYRPLVHPGCRDPAPVG